MCENAFPLRSTGSLAVQVRAVDWAGNVSAPSVAKQVKGLGCAATPADAAPGLALLGLVTLASARRSRTQRSR